MRGGSLSLSNAGSALYSMVRHPYVGREQLVAFQNTRLRRLVDYAYRHVAYYRDLFDRHGLKPHHIKTIQDLAVVPITTRSDLQALAVEEIVARQVKPKCLITRSSSGSSGRPFIVRRTWLEERVHGGFAWRALHGLGLRAGDKNCMILRLQNSQPQDHQMIQRILAAFGIGRQGVINALQSPEDIIQALKKYRPAIVSGYSNVLARIARTVNRKELQAFQLRFVNTGGEVLTPLMRHQIEEGFGVPVYDTYGSIEFHLLAWECKTTGEYHACEDGMIMEVLRNGVPAAEGERGEVVGTDLHSFAMPLIRYRLGDLVTRGSQTCRCGQPFSTIRSIQGRMNDYFVLPGNKVVHPYELGILAVPWIREFQVTQESLDTIVMKVIPFHIPSTQETAALVQSVIDVIGQGIQFTVVLVTEIPMDVSGKFRVYRSRIHSAYDGLVWPEQREKPHLVNEPMSESPWNPDVDKKNTR